MKSRLPAGYIKLEIKKVERPRPRCDMYQAKATYVVNDVSAKSEFCSNKLTAIKQAVESLQDEVYYHTILNNKLNVHMED